jgi:hypothetical protein
MKFSYFWIVVIILGLSFSANAQDELSSERKQAVDSLAIEKVRDLSKYISIVGSKETPWSEANRVIDRAEELFMSGSEIGVSSITKAEISYYLTTVARHLYREEVFKEQVITSQ